METIKKIDIRSIVVKGLSPEKFTEIISLSRISEEKIIITEDKDEIEVFFIHSDPVAGKRLVEKLLQWEQEKQKQISLFSEEK